MRYLPLIIFVLVVTLILVFWDNLKAFLVMLGFCVGCNAPKTEIPTKPTLLSRIADTLSIPNTSQVAPVDVSNPEATCEVFQNHTGNIPHLFANQRQNELVGTVWGFSQPQFNAYGTWKLMQPLGPSLQGDGKQFWAYREPFLGATKVNLRTREGCPSYLDVRETQPSGYLGMTPALPYVAPINNHTNLNLVFNMAGDLDHAASEYNLWEIQIKDHHPGLMYRINGGGWQGTELRTDEPTNQRSNVIHTFIGANVVGKDFIIDFTKDGGASIDRYKVIRNSAGGHFSVTATMIRAEDGRVYVNSYQGDKFVAMKLGNVSHKGWGNFWDLGNLGVGDYSYQLKSATTGYVLDNALMVQVR